MVSAKATKRVSDRLLVCLPWPSEHPPRHNGGNGSQRPSLGPQRDDFHDSLLLALIHDKLAVVAQPEPERKRSGLELRLDVHGL
jgi:hypothetical protein